MRDPLLDPPSWAPSWLPTVDDVHRRPLLRWLIGVVLFAGLAACVAEGANAPADPELGEPGTTAVVPGDDTAPDSDQPAGGSLADRFGTVAARLTAVSGEVVELCLLHAETAAERSQGLMQVTDLEGHDGMLFSNEEPVESAFFMYRTLLPLTLAWWDGEGRFLGATDMAPCPAEDSDDCERYPPPAPYRFGLEVVQGHAVVEHFAPGATLGVTGEACAARAT